MNHWAKITKCIECGKDIEDKGDKDPLKMCYGCAVEWMLQQFCDKSDVKRIKK